MKKALVVWGGWAGHEPEACAGIVKDMLESTGMSVCVESDIDALADPDIMIFDLIVPVITQSEIKAETLTNLLAAVESGVGFAGFHGGMADSFRNEVRYQFMVGGQWVAHPGNIIDYDVNITKPHDPVMHGLSDFPYHSEQYYMHIDPSNEVLATTTFSGEHLSWTKDVVMPVVWKRHYGDGRVFYSALGHSAGEFECSAMKTILQRGMAWACRDRQIHQ